MMPPTRIEQLNNFQDAVQSPDGLDRLRALQSIEQALPSSQGLMGMPQVQAPMPMVPRQYGGEVGTGGLVEVLDDGTQVFSNTEEGILNRSLHGGIMQGQTQTASAPSGFSGGPTASGTLASGTSAPSNFTISTGQDKYGNTIGDLTGTQDYYDLNFAARDAGQDTFMYGDKLMQVDPGYLRGGGINPFISNRLPEGLQQQMIDRPDLFTPGSFDPFGNPNLSSIQKIQGDPTDLSFYKEAPYLPTEDFSRDISGKYNSYYEANQAAKEAGSPTFMYGDKLAKTDPGLLPDYVGAPKPFISNAVPEKFISAGLYLPPGWSNMSAQALADAQPNSRKKRHVGMGVYAKHGGPIISKQYGGEIGTGGLVDILDDGTQVFSNTEEGILNRSLHGGMLQGQQQTATAPSSFSGGTDAAGTLASGTSAAPAVLPKTAVDSSFLSPVMDLENVQQRGGIYNASDIRDAGITLSRPSDAPETIIQQGQSQVGSMYRDPRTGEIPYALYNPQPINTFGQGYDLKDMDYFTANALALSEGADRFIYNDEYAAVDPGLLSNYNYSELGTKPYADPVGPIQGVSYAGTDAGKIGNYNLPISSSDREEARLKAEGFTRDHSGRLTVPGTSRAEKFRQLMESGIDMSNPYQAAMHGFKHGGSLADTAEGLASFGRYGDNILVHMNPEELSGLASLGQITYNPVTGLPEAFSLKGLFKGIRKIAPIALAVAAPYALGAGGLGLFAGAPGVVGAGGMSALSFGLATGIGSLAGNLIAGAKPKDALKSAILSGAIGGVGQGISTGNWAGSAAAKAAPVTTPISTGTDLVSKSVTAAPGGVSPQFGQQFGTMTPSNIASGSARIGLGGTVSRPPLQLAQASVPISPGSPTGYTGQLQPTVATDMPSNLGSKIQFTGGGSAVAPNVASPSISSGNLIQRVKESPLVTDTSQAFKNIGSDIARDYGTWKGAAKLVGMDLMQTDWEQQYANEAKQKEMELQKAGYTVDTGFDGQTVIRDSQGVIMPRNLTPSMILDRALGRSPRQRMVSRYGYGQAKHGGLISLAHGGEFSGQVPGDGHGMEDNVYMPIKEGSEQVGTLAVSPSEYVVDSYTMAALGNGNTDEGAKVMDKVVKHVRKKAYGTTKQPNEISGLKTLEPMMERARQ
jgi:hypothetical protein